MTKNSFFRAVAFGLSGLFAASVCAACIMPSCDGSSEPFASEQPKVELGAWLQTGIKRLGQDGSITSRNEYEYDENGNRTKSVAFRSDGRITSWYEEEYDANGNRIKFTSYYYNGSIESFSEFEYDSSGNVIRKKHMNADGSIKFTNELEYDANGRELRDNSIDADGSVFQTIESEYDKKGNLIKRVEFKSYDGVDMKSEYKYDYDSKGNLIRETLSNIDGRILKIDEFKFDAMAIRSAASL